jgi:hypothetical protein
LSGSLLSFFLLEFIDPRYRCITQKKGFSGKCIIDNTENERKASNRKQLRPKKNLHDATTASRKAEVNHMRADKHKHTMLHSMHVVAHLGFGLAPHIQLLHTQRNVTGKVTSTYPVDTLESGLCNPLIFPESLHDANLGLLHTHTTTHLPHIPLRACSLSLTTTSTFALFSYRKNASQTKQNKITPDFFVIFFSGFLPSLPAFPHTNQ